MRILQDGICVFSAIEPADTYWKKLKGLMFRPGMGPEEGLLLKNCSRIHTNHMRFTIDVIYLSEQYQVLDCETVRPWRLGKKVPGAVHILEVSEGCKSRVRQGGSLTTEEKEA